MLLKILISPAWVQQTLSFALVGQHAFRRLGRNRRVRYSGSDSSSSSSQGASLPSVPGSDTWTEYQNPNNRDDQVVSALSGDGGIKVTAVTIRNIMNEMMLMHSMTEIPLDAMGRLMTCGLLMSNGMQDEQTVQITMKGDGPLRGAMAIATGAGGVRGYVGSPMFGGDTLSEGIGLGSVQVVKNHPDWPNPYNGITAIRSGEIDRDVGAYLAESEQRTCALAAATSVNGIICTSAGGYLVEQLPGMDEGTAQKVEENLSRLVEMDGGDKLPTNLLLKGITPIEICGTLLDGLNMKPLQQIKPQFACECSAERLFRAIRLLPRIEVDQLLEREEKIEARCQFCGKEYRMTAEEVRQYLNKATGDPSTDSDINPV